MILEYFNDVEFYLGLLERYAGLHDIIAFILPFIEAFLPFLPLSLFVTVNVLALGFIKGYIYSYIGTVTGSICVFLLLKHFAKDRLHRYIDKREKLRNVFAWINHKGFIPIFMLYSFPFTPSSLVCAISAVADLKNEEYILATIFGKGIMILYLSFIGYNIKSIFDNPLKSIILIVITVIFAGLGRFYSARYEKK